MSRNHYEEISSGSSDEEKLVIDETPKAKRPTKRRRAIDEPSSPASSHQKRRAKVIESDEEQHDKKKESKMSTKLLLDQNEQKWQKAMDIALSVISQSKVDTKDLTLLPDHGTMECLRKAAQAWLNEQKKFVPLTFSTQKSLQTVMARFLLDFILKSAEVTPLEWNPNGCVVWDHHIEDKLHCLHGLAMINKEQIVEMDISSEGGQRALKETPEKAKIVNNKWGRSVVQVKNSDAMCCYYDMKSPLNSYSAESCGHSYTDGVKALQAFNQISAFLKASYPQMPKAGQLLLMPVVCECNYGYQVSQLLGRQTCKVTPFTLSAIANVEPSPAMDPKVLATVNHPAILVFQCCNPIFRHTKANPQKNCDFKISATDVITALQLVKQMWVSRTGMKAPVAIQEFKWQPHLRVQNTLLPTGQEDLDESLF